MRQVGKAFPLHVIYQDVGKKTLSSFTVFFFLWLTSWMSVLVFLEGLAVPNREVRKGNNRTVVIMLN